MDVQWDNYDLLDVDKELDVARQNMKEYLERKKKQCQVDDTHDVLVDGIRQPCDGIRQLGESFTPIVDVDKV